MRVEIRKEKKGWMSYEGKELDLGLIGMKGEIGAHPRIVSQMLLQVLQMFGEEGKV